MARYVITLLFWLLLSCVTVAQESYVATYKLEVGPLTVGAMVRSFEIQSDGTYRFESKLHATGLASLVSKDELHETSSGVFRQGKFHPSAYTHVRKSKKPLNVDTRFDRENATVNTIVNGTQSSSPLLEGMLDKLVYQAAIMHDLDAGKSKLSYRITDRGEEKSYDPVVGDTAVVDTQLGRFNTVTVIRQRTKDKRRTIFWCAPELGYLPIKVSNREKDGSETIALLTDYRRLDDAGASQPESSN